MYFKQIICICLATVTLITSSRGIVCWLEYKVNYNYIVRNLCVERNKPKNSCHGKCHLKQNLNKNEDGKENSEENLPYLRIKFDENSIAILELKDIVNFRIQSKSRSRLMNEYKINTEKDDPPSPPPKSVY